MTAKVRPRPTTPRSVAPCFFALQDSHAGGTFFARASAEKLENFCREDLASYKKPHQVVFVDALPRNALGKVLKHQVGEGSIEAEE